METNGQLSQRSVDDLLAGAIGERLSGRIDLVGPARATLHLSNGFIAHIAVGDRPLGLAPDASKDEVHHALAGRLAELLAWSDGTFEIHESPRVPDEARWLFGPRVLLASARQVHHGDTGRPAARTIELIGRPSGKVVHLSTDAWRLVASMAAPVDRDDAARGLGWTDDRLQTTLDELAALHLLAISEAVAPLAASPSPPAPAVADPPAPPAREPDRPPPPPSRSIDLVDRAEVPTPSATGEPAVVEPAAGGRTRASALRRLIHTLR